MKLNYDKTVYSDWRTRDILTYGFDEIKKLLQYLYMSENHKIVYNNGLCDLEMTMTPGMCLMIRNMNFPDFPPTHKEINLSEMMAIIEILEKTPATEFPNAFKNRWEEVKSICAANMLQNEKYDKR